MTVYKKSKFGTIRCLLDEDIDRIGQTLTDQRWHFDRSVFEQYLIEQEKGQRMIFVAEFMGEIMGYVTLLPKATTGPFQALGLPEIENLNVFLKFQKNGIGSLLMDVAENIAKETNRGVTLSVGLHGGYGSAQRLYVKRGYVPDGSGVWYRGKNHDQYAPCVNDDDLILYMMKVFP